jgi:hypothetical protein
VGIFGVVTIVSPGGGGGVFEYELFLLQAV